MIDRLATSETVSSAGATARVERSSVATWLDVLVRLLDVPETERSGIRAELEAHLDERMRDLMMDGVTPDRALVVAVGELGETAELARRFNDAFRQPRRRQIMHLSVIGAGFGAVGLGFFAFTGTPGGSAAGMIESSVFIESAAEEAPELLATRMSLQMVDGTLGEMFEYTRAMTGANMYVHWKQFEDSGIDRDATVSIELEDVSLARTLALVGDQIEVEFAWWYEDQLLEIAPRDYLDQRSVTLVSYDIDPTLESLMDTHALDYEESLERITAVLQEFVSPDDWTDMGGTLAQLQYVGGHLFIQAPKRMHQKIAWVLGELSAAIDDDLKE